MCSRYFIDGFQPPITHDQLGTTTASNKIRILVDHLALNVTNKALINALLLGLSKLANDYLLTNP